jgi:hypothetical protein
VAQREPKYQYTGYTTDKELVEAFNEYRENSNHGSNSSIVIQALEEKLEREGYYND